MHTTSAVLANYGRPGLADEVLRRASAVAGDAPLTSEHLALFDEFHMGGRLATAWVTDALDVPPGGRVLDVGSGLGGPARRVAAATGAHVLGVDLTPEYVEVARVLSARVGLDTLTEFVLGDGARLPADDASVDRAMLLHVGMNVLDKAALFTEVRRVLTPGGRLVVYDVVLAGDRQPDYPLPWAADPADSFVAPRRTYLDAFEAAGLVLEREQDLGDAVSGLLERQRAGEVPGQQQMIEVLFGDSGPARFAHLAQALGAGVASPTLFAVRPA